jgi:hypothetical protein
MRYYLDTEFYEDGQFIDPISIGIVSEDGREFYAEFPPVEVPSDHFVSKNVLPHLRGGFMSPENIRFELLSFIGADRHPQFWGWFASYDWIVVCQIFGTMMQLPDDFPKYIHDLKSIQKIFLPDFKFPVQQSVPHNALEDARELRDRYELLKTELGYQDIPLP